MDMIEHPGMPPGQMVMQQVVVTRVMREDDIVDHVCAIDRSGGEINLAEALGMIELAKFTLYESRTCNEDDD